MRVKVAAVTLALSLPSFLWPPKPARAATVDFAAEANAADTGLASNEPTPLLFRIELRAIPSPVGASLPLP
jgi:hypothetical protein